MNKSNMIRGLKIYIAAKLNGFFKRKKINGKYYYMKTSVSKAFWPFINNQVEIEETSLIKKRCASYKNFVDVGANLGIITLTFADSANDVNNIFSFEPNPYTFSKMVEFVGTNNKKGVNINFVCAAVGEKLGFTDFFISDRDYLGVMSSQQKTDPESKLVKVPVIKLDDFFENIEHGIDFIKIDVEGAELFVLKGANAVIKKFRPDLLIEIHGPFLDSFGYTVDDIFNYLGTLGYQANHIVNDKKLSLESFMKDTGKLVKHPIHGFDMSKFGYGNVLFTFNEE